MYKIFDMRTCGLSHQIKGPVIVNLTILQLKPVSANFTVVGPLIWCDNPHVRMSKINNNGFHNMGRSQICAGACYVFRTSKPHSRTLWGTLAPKLPLPPLLPSALSWSTFYFPNELRPPPPVSTVYTVMATTNSSHQQPGVFIRDRSISQSWFTDSII